MNVDLDDQIFLLNLSCSFLSAITFIIFPILSVKLIFKYFEILYKDYDANYKPAILWTGDSNNTDRFTYRWRAIWFKLNAQNKFTVFFHILTIEKKLVFAFLFISI